MRTARYGPLPHSEHSTVSAAHANSTERGAWAEGVALQFALKQGLREEARNYRCRFGEIDLILLEDNILVFVEVRFRPDDALVSAAQSIGNAKQRRLLASAEHYLQRDSANDTRDCRFDVMAVSGNEHHPVVQWLRDAIQA